MNAASEFFVFALVSVPCWAQIDGHNKNATPNPGDMESLDGDALAHRELAMKYLQEGTDRNLPSRLSEAQVEFDRATADFASFASVATNIDEDRRIALAASGLLMSQHAADALKLILGHPRALSSPQIMRVRAEVFLALDMGKEAGLAYEQWIGQGKCMGGYFYRNWPGERKIGDGMAVLMPKGIHDPCAVLAPDLRARLETLYRLLGHPNDLPKKNYPSYPVDAY